MKNWRQTVLSQYQNKPLLMPMLEAIDAWLSPDVNYENFFEFVWNVLSADGGNGGGYSYGLDVWGRIVNAELRAHRSSLPPADPGEGGV
jgi:hypothetical protein